MDSHRSDSTAWPHDSVQVTGQVRSQLHLQTLGGQPPVRLHRLATRLCTGHRSGQVRSQLHRLATRLCTGHRSQVRSGHSSTCRRWVDSHRSDSTAWPHDSVQVTGQVRSQLHLQTLGGQPPVRLHRLATRLCTGHRSQVRSGQTPSQLHRLATRLCTGHRSQVRSDHSSTCRRWVDSHRSDSTAWPHDSVQVRSGQITAPPADAGWTATGPTPPPGHTTLYRSQVRSGQVRSQVTGQVRSQLHLQTLGGQPSVRLHRLVTRLCTGHRSGQVTAPPADAGRRATGPTPPPGHTTLYRSQVRSGQVTAPPADAGWIATGPTPPPGHTTLYRSGQVRSQLHLQTLGGQPPVRLHRLATRLCTGHRSGQVTAPPADAGWTATGPTPRPGHTTLYRSQVTGQVRSQDRSQLHLQTLGGQSPVRLHRLATRLCTGHRSGQVTAPPADAGWTATGPTPPPGHTTLYRSQVTGQVRSGHRSQDTE